MPEVCRSCRSLPVASDVGYCRDCLDRLVGVALARHPVERAIEQALQRHDPRTLPGRKQLVAAVVPVVRRIADPEERDVCLRLLARRSGVREDVLREVMALPDAVPWVARP